MARDDSVVTDDAIVALKRDLGDGYARLARGGALGESLLLPGGSLGIGGVRFPDLNWGDTYGSGAMDAFRAFVRRLRERGLPGVITTLPGAAEEARVVAAELGVSGPEESAPFMVCRREAARLAASDLACRRLTGGADTEVLADVLAQAFECPLPIMRGLVGAGFLQAPDVDFIAASLDGEVAAVAGAVRVGDTVGVYGVATRPALRRKGAGGAALSAAMAFQLERGATAFALQSSASGLPVYERLGFSTVASVTLWVVEAG